MKHTFRPHLSAKKKRNREEEEERRGLTLGETCWLGLVLGNDARSACLHHGRCQNNKHRLSLSNQTVAMERGNNPHPPQKKYKNLPFIHSSRIWMSHPPSSRIWMSMLVEYHRWDVYRFVDTYESWTCPKNVNAYRNPTN